MSSRIHALAAAGIRAYRLRPRARGILILDALGFTDGWALCNNGATLVRVSGGQCEIVEGATFITRFAWRRLPPAISGVVFASITHPDIHLLPSRTTRSRAASIASCRWRSWPPRRPRRSSYAADMDRDNV